MHLRTLIIAVIALVAAGCRPLTFGAPDAPPAQWWKGNLHTHSLWSDGDDYPETILDWYRRNGYDFVAMTDHDIIPMTERWIDASNNADARTGLARYLEWFPGAVDLQQRADTTFVRLQSFADYRMAVEVPGRFLVLRAQEITQHVGAEGVHVNAWNIDRLIPKQEHASEREIIRTNLRDVHAPRGDSGRTVVAQLNHPNYLYSQTAEDLISLPELRLFEVYNGHPLVNNAGDSVHAGTERLWDIALSERLARGLPPIYATATDDAHDYHRFAPAERNPGRGWVMVRAPALSAEAITAAIASGSFYASTGVVLDDLTETEHGLVLRIRGEPGVSYRTQFIGTVRDYERTSAPRQDSAGRALTRRYSDDVGRVLAEVQGTEAGYEFTGEELYVRARVVSSKPKANAPTPDAVEVAWTQPVIVAAPLPPADTFSVVTLNIWHDQRDWPRRLDAIVESLRSLYPDVIMLQEVLQHEGLPNQAAELAQRLGYDWYFSSVDSIGQARRYGNAILVRHPVVATNWVALTPLNDYRTAAHVRVRAAGHDVDLYATHLHHTPAGDSIRARQIEHLMRFITVTRGEGPIVLGGDFNAVVDAPVMQPLRDVFESAFDAVHADSAARTRSTLVPELGHAPRRIDHIYVDAADFIVRSAEIILDDPVAEGLWPSDHFGVHARLRFRGPTEAHDSPASHDTLSLGRP